MSQNCRIRPRQNCTLVKAKPVQIREIYLEDGSLLMRTLLYTVGSRSYPECIKISEDLKNKYLSEYSFREDHRGIDFTWWIHSKK